MTADIEFEGTYTQVLKLLELIDGNQQKIVSSELELGGKKSLSSTEENKNPDLTSGKIKLRFYQVKDVERYVTLWRVMSIRRLFNLPIGSLHLRFRLGRQALYL